MFMSGMSDLSVGESPALTAVSRLVTTYYLAATEDQIDVKSD